MLFSPPYLGLLSPSSLPLVPVPMLVAGEVSSFSDTSGPQLSPILIVAGIFQQCSYCPNGKFGWFLNVEVVEESVPVSGMKIFLLI